LFEIVTRPEHVPLINRVEPDGDASTASWITSNISSVFAFATTHVDSFVLDDVPGDSVGDVVEGSEPVALVHADARPRTTAGMISAAEPVLDTSEQVQR